MARVHLADMLRRTDTDVVALCEPSAAASCRGRAVRPPRPARAARTNPTGSRSSATHAERARRGRHHHAARLPFRPGEGRLEAGLDVLLEKPMVMTAEEADGADRNPRPDGPAAGGRVPGQPLAAGARSVATAPIRASWARSSTSMRSRGRTGRSLTEGTWRQQPALSGGGFLFDTGAHMLNTVADLAGEDFAQVAAWMENDGRPVDIRAVVMGRLASGALVTMNACGSAIPSCHSDIRVFTTKAILRTGIWGEVLEMQRTGAGRLPQGPLRRRDAGLGAVPQRPRRPAANPSPPEVGLRMARLWDAIRESSSQRRRGRDDPVHGAGRGGLDDPRHGLERVPPGALRRAGPGRLPRRDPRGHRRGPARARRLRGANGDARRARARADRRPSSPRPTC